MEELSAYEKSILKKQKEAKDCTVMPFHTKKGQKRPSKAIVSSFFQNYRLWGSYLSLQNKDANIKNLEL